MLLRHKNAVVYGGGGLIGGAVARAFAREGARVFLAGRTQGPLDRVADEIHAEGGLAETAQVNAMDERAVEAYTEAVIETAGGIDVTLNAVGIHGELQGTPLASIPQEEFSAPIVTGTTANFLTARAVARHMVERGAGTILMVSATATWSKAALLEPIAMGGFGVACAAIEGLARSLAGELGPSGVRVACLRLEATAELLTAIAESNGIGWTTPAKLRALLEGDSLLRRLPTAAEVGDVAAIMASDRTAAMTGVVANVSCGAVIQ